MQVWEAPFPANIHWLEEKHQKYFIQDKYGLYKNEMYNIPDELYNKYIQKKINRTFLLFYELDRKRFNIFAYYKTAKLIKYEKDNILKNSNSKVSFRDIIVTYKILQCLNKKANYDEDGYFECLYELFGIDRKSGKSYDI